MSAPWKTREVRFVEGEYEVRCPSCRQFWPGVRDFWYSSVRCRACHLEARRVIGFGLVLPRDGQYAKLKRMLMRIPPAQRTPEMRRAIRRAYWREWKEIRRREAVA